MSRIRIPTLLVQGQSDTLFNLQEAVGDLPGAARAGHAGEDALALVRPLRRRHRRREQRDQPRDRLREPDGARVVRLLPARHRRGPRSTSRSCATGSRYKGDAAPAVGVDAALPGRPRTSTLFLLGHRPARRRAGAASQRGQRRLRRRPRRAGRHRAAASSTAGAATRPARSRAYDERAARRGHRRRRASRELTRQARRADVRAGARPPSPASKLVLFAKLYDVDPASGDARCRATSSPRCASPT